MLFVPLQKVAIIIQVSHDSWKVVNYFFYCKFQDLESRGKNPLKACIFLVVQMENTETIFK